MRIKFEMLSDGSITNLDDDYENTDISIVKIDDIYKIRITVEDKETMREFLIGDPNYGNN